MRFFKGGGGSEPPVSPSGSVHVRAHTVSTLVLTLLYVFSGSNKSLDQFQYSDKDIADTITACASKVSFVGLNGLIEFNKFGDPSINVQISQIQGNDFWI